MLIIEHVPELPTTALIEYEERGEKAKRESLSITKLQGVAEVSDNRQNGKREEEKTKGNEEKETRMSSANCMQNFVI